MFFSGLTICQRSHPFFSFVVQTLLGETGGFFFCTLYHHSSLRCLSNVFSALGLIRSLFTERCWAPHPPPVCRKLKSLLWGCCSGLITAYSLFSWLLDEKINEQRLSTKHGFRLLKESFRARVMSHKLQRWKAISVEWVWSGSRGLGGLHRSDKHEDLTDLSFDIIFCLYMWGEIKVSGSTVNPNI